MKKTGGETMWVHIFKCFCCGKEGHDMTQCPQCEEAFYCDRDCETRHAQAHGPVCTATVAAKARRARRERVARAVRESGKAVEGAEEDTMCVICQAPPVEPVKVRWVVVQGGNSITC
jgi:hydroxymethylpyrimidine/phosphomethylpyrimidine kinase